MKGIDVSRWQGVIDWELVKSDGVQFVFIKATEGKGYVDPRFKENVTGAAKAGLKVGAYHFARFKSKAEAIAEANFFINTVRPYPITWPLVLDLEVNEGGLDREQLTEAAKAFIDTIKAAGYTAALYVNKNYLDNYIYADRIGAALWLARYRDFERGPGVQCDIWQYTDKGKVKGITGYVDLNEAYKDFSAPTKTAAKQQPKKQPAAAEMVYIVKAGDTLSEIAARYNTTVQALQQLNGIKDPDKIYVGQKIKIKGKPPNAKVPIYYTIQKGDTLTEIAKKFNTTVAALQKLNGIKDANKIFAGQKIRVQ
jgi:lysozyme